MAEPKALAAHFQLEAKDPDPTDDHHSAGRAPDGLFGDVDFGVGHSTTFSNSCSYASQMLKMDDEDSDSAIIALDPMKHNAF